MERIKMLTGICTYSIEDLRNLFDEEKNKKVPSETDYELMTVAEYNSKEFSKNTKIILVDNIAKLLSIRDLPILDIKYFNGSWRRDEDFSREIWWKLSLDESWLKEIPEKQFNIIPDFNLGEYSFITHLNEFHKSPFLFLKRIHNILGKIQKESIVCSNYYKQLLKEKLINKRMSDLYLDFLDKKKQEYPEIFKYMKFMMESDYGEKDRREAEKKKLKGVEGE